MITYRNHRIEVTTSLGMPVAIVASSGKEIRTFRGATEHDVFLLAKAFIDGKQGS